jgi:DNA polymerase-3 subunit gamma/tau
MVRELLGGVGPEALIETTYALSRRRSGDALRIVDRLSNEGKDLGQFVGELLAHLRNLMLLPHAPEVALAGIGADERAPLEEQANAVPTAEVVRLVEALGDALGRMRRGGDPKLELELVFLKLTRDYTEPDLISLLGRLETLEKTVGNGGVARTPSRSTAPATTSNEVGEEPRPVERGPAHSAVEPDAQSDLGPVPEEAGDRPDSAVDLASSWPGIMGELKRRRQALTAAVYGEARVEGFDGNVLRLVYPEEQSFHVGMAREKGHLDKLGAVLEERLGSKPLLEVRAAEGEATAPEEPPATATPVEPRPISEEDPTKAANPDGSGDTVAENGVPRGQASGGDEIRTHHEVFEMAREFDLFGRNERE